MQTNELLELIRKLEAERNGAQGTDALPITLRLRRSTGTELEQIVANANALYGPRPVQPEPPRSTNAAAPNGSVAADVLKTAGMVTGVGPLVTGLLKLFGGGSEPAPAPVLPHYALPRPLSVEAGLSGDRSFVPVSYSQDGSARSGETRTGPQATPAQINVHVQAMDSRSFLDHSDEIARAVRDAMLRSHSLNDVVTEL